MDIMKLLKLVGELVFKSRVGGVVLAFDPGESNIPNTYPFLIIEDFPSGGVNHKSYTEGEFLAALKDTLEYHGMTEELDYHDEAPQVSEDDDYEVPPPVHPNTDVEALYYKSLNDGSFES